MLSYEPTLKSYLINQATVKYCQKCSKPTAGQLMITLTVLNKNQYAFNNSVTSEKSETFLFAENNQSGVSR